MRVDPKPVDIHFTYKPLPKQVEFHQHPARYRAFGGGVGNGKSSAGCVEGLAMALENPGCTGLIARQTRPTLKATTQQTFFKGGGGDPAKGDFTGCPQELIRSWNKTEQRLELINGSIIHFWPLDEPDKLSNLNLGWFMIDQAEEVPEEMFMMLMGRLREMKGPRKGIVLFNPNGHDWIWSRFVKFQNVHDDHGLIHAKTTDNPNLPKDYIDSLMGWPEAWRKRFMDGSFDVFTEQIWPEFDPDTHLINPMPIDPYWEITEGIDHGRRNPTAVLWAAFFESRGHDYCFIVNEHYEKGKLVGYHANKILDERKKLVINPNYTVIDASAAQKDPNTGRSVVDEYWDHSIVTIPSDRHVIARVNRVAEWLQPDPNVPHPITGEMRESGFPRLYIYKNCINLAEHIPGYKWKPTLPSHGASAPEKPLEKDDHDVDAMGYILMTRPPVGRRKYEDNHGGDSRADAYWRRHRDRMKGGGKTHSMMGSEA